MTKKSATKKFKKLIEKEGDIIWEALWKMAAAMDAWEKEVNKGERL